MANKPDWPTDERESSLRTLRIVDDQSRARDRSLETSIEQLAVMVDRLHTDCARHEHIARVETRLDSMAARESAHSASTKIWVAVIGLCAAGLSAGVASWMRSDIQETARQQAAETAERVIRSSEQRDRAIAREAAEAAIHAQGVMVRDVITPDAGVSSE